MTPMQVSKLETSSVIDAYQREIDHLHNQLLDQSISTEQRQNALMIISTTHELIDRELEKLQQKKSHNFVQLYRENLEDLSKLARKNAMATSILFFFFKIIDRQNSVIISQTALAEHFNVSRVTIGTSIKALEQAGFIKILRTGGSSAYLINSDVVWTTYNDKRSTAKFTAQVMVNLNEQTLKTRREAKTKQVPYTLAEVTSDFAPMIEQPA
jgi:DNA-binding transcriptional regulator YhcF (GntR family)